MTTKFVAVLWALMGVHVYPGDPLCSIDYHFSSDRKTLTSELFCIPDVTMSVTVRLSRTAESVFAAGQGGAVRLETTK